MGAKSRVIDRDRGWAQMLKQVDAMAGKSYVKVGVLGDKGGGLHEQDPDGKASPLTLTEIGAVNEFGSEDGHVPERSFLRSTFDRMREEMTGDAAKLLPQVLDGKLSVATALNVLGAKLAAEVKKTITVIGVPPPNAPSTVARKTRAGDWNRGGQAQGVLQWGVRALVDTGRLVGSIAWAVVTGRDARGPLT